MIITCLVYILSLGSTKVAPLNDRSLLFFQILGISPFFSFLLLFFLPCLLLVLIDPYKVGCSLQKMIDF